MTSITLNAPAKINLYLDVIGKRPDGYHNIETIFQKIALYDKVTVGIIEKGIRVNCRHPGIPSRAGNIAYKAASLMKKKFGIRNGVGIDIVKKIPVAAGLGGGSSDAACVIIAMNRLFRLGLSAKRLIELAKPVGADVPFLVSAYGCAVGKGIGERLKEIKDSPVYHILLLAPPLKLYTKTIYRKVNLPLTKTGHNVNMLAHALTHSKGSDITGLLYNRLEDIVLADYPIVRKAKEALLSLHAEGVLLSGSGPCVFGLFKSRKEAMRAEEKLKRDGRWRLFLTKTI